MNRFICKSMKAKGKFKRVLCEICKYSSRCQDLHEYQQGHADEIRELSKPEPERGEE